MHRLAPGDYEIYNFDIFANGYPATMNWKSRTDFSIPFTIRPGATTYVGDFQARKVVGKNVFGMEVAAGAYFAWSDKQARDIAIARSKVAIERLESVPVDAKAVGSPYIRSVD